MILKIAAAVVWISVQIGQTAAVVALPVIPVKYVPRENALSAVRIALITAVETVWISKQAGPIAAVAAAPALSENFVWMVTAT